jgi:hypothetical protein
MEQHERVGGRVRALHPSPVSQLDPQTELLDGILSNLPMTLVGDSDHDHPYQDGSVVDSNISNTISILNIFRNFSANTVVRHHLTGMTSA